MGVPPLGPGSSDLSVLLQQLALQPRPGTGTLPTAAVAITEDQIAGLLQALSAPAITELLSNIEQRIMPENPAAVNRLLQAASSAVAAGDVPLALVKVRELLTLSPRQAETVSSEPVLEPIRNEVVNLVRQLTAQARFQAQDNVAAAAQTIAPDRATSPIATQRSSPLTVMRAPAQTVAAQPSTSPIVTPDSAQTVAMQPFTGPAVTPRSTQTIATQSSAQSIGTEPPGRLPDSEIDLRTVLALALRFVESGRLADNLIASELARIVITHYEPAAETAAPAANDSKAVTPFQLLARPEIKELIARIEERLLPPDPAIPKEILREASSAVAAGDVPRALAKVKELLLADPRQAETIASEPSLRPIQRDVVIIIRQLISQTRTQAQQMISAAEQSIGAGGAKKPPSAEVEPRSLLTIANYIIDSPRLLDYRIAMELAQIALTPDEWQRKVRRAARAPKPIATDRPAPARERFQRAWRRVPLLILLGLARAGIGVWYWLPSFAETATRQFRSLPRILGLQYLGRRVPGPGWLRLLHARTEREILSRRAGWSSTVVHHMPRSLR